MNRKLQKTVFVLIAVSALASCGGADMSDIDEYMQQVRQKPAPPIDPVPSFPQYESFIYASGGARSPFEKPQALEVINFEDGDGANAQNVKPDELRPKEFLEQFNISSIVMVGTVVKDGAMWGLVDDGTSNIHRVQVGNYMGRNYGKIYYIDKSRIDIKEIIPNGPDGWLERPKTLQLQEVADK